MCIHQGKCIHTGIHQGKWPCLAGRNRFHRFLRLTAPAVVQLELSKEGHLGVIHCLLGNYGSLGT